MAGQAAIRSLFLPAFMLLPLVGCAESMTGDQDPQQATLRIEPANPLLTAGTALQFKAVDHSGAELAVHWRLQNPDFGTISSTGLYTSCWAAGVTQITALLQADSTRRASTQVTLAQQAVSLVQVSSLTYATTSTPARIDSIAGGINATVRVTAGILACRAVTSVRLELVGQTSITPLGQVTFTPALTTDTTLTLFWNASAIPPGWYGLRAVMTVRDHGDVTSPAQTLQIVF
jgi:hypothetical protein